MFAFTSGYGVYKSTNHLKGKELVNAVSNRIFRFLRKYWIVFFTMVPIGFYLGVWTFEPIKFLWGILSFRLYNGEWWYVKQYWLMLLCYLLFITILRLKRNDRMLVISITSIAMIIGTLVMGIARIKYLYNFIFGGGSFVFYLFVFFEGVLFSAKKVFEKIYSVTYFNSNKAWFSIIMCIFTRIMITSKVEMYYLDFIYAPIIILSISTLANEADNSFLFSGLKMFGKHSTYMWLVHSFFIYYFWGKLVMIPKISLLIYAWLVILSLVVAIIYEKFEIIIAFIFGSCFIGLNSKDKSKIKERKP